ncbi:hypothetical protein HYH02_010863 [Chlamydomonas schloesseri]|uniref:Uncharacterized protein n=1 Tax=Chlamydomonas schloesseri TaxID=2026947 RepID=A0A835T8N7_9CHLO|nr:hypothetical protein HYH02_010863 [Chlamydomonas schloesseri]|eukprot:KAG2438408.1 hypothetical protein HYH02_010863 [Chlamydomonas schloesseri]
MTVPGQASALPSALVARCVSALPRALLPGATAAPWAAGFLSHGSIYASFSGRATEAKEDERSQPSCSTGNVAAANFRHAAALRLGFGAAPRKGQTLPSADRSFPQSPSRGFAASATALAAAAAAEPAPAAPQSGGGQSPPTPQQQKQQQQDKKAQQRLERPPNDVVYYGPLSQQHKLLKRISIANTLVAAAAAPAIVTWADNISLVSRYGLASSLVLFGLITTGALHWVAQPYVHELRYTAATGQLEVRTTTLLGSSRWNSFNVDEVQPLPWNRPVATFMAKGRFYYIDVYSFPDEALLRRLTPDEADVPQGYKDKDDDDD